MKNKHALIEQLIRISSRGRRVEEIARELGEPVDKIQALLESKLRMPEGFLLTSWKDHLGMMYWQVLAPEAPPPKIEPRAYRYVRSKDEAYHRVFIPDDIVDENGRPAKYIELFPFSDVHYGHRRCDKGNFMRDVKEVARRPNRYGFLNGDNMEMSLGDSAGGAAWAEQDLTPEEQREKSEHIYRPIAHKLIVARTGNHDGRPGRNGSGMNPLKEVCKSLGGIPYFNGPSNMDVIWRGYSWSFFMKHGTGSSNTAGGKLNTAGRDRGFTDFRNFFIMGHVHDEMSHKVVRKVRRRVYDADGKLERFWEEELREYKVICPSYLLYSGTYAEEAGYSPGSRNTIVIQLFASGDYRVVSSRRGQNTMLAI